MLRVNKVHRVSTVTTTVEILQGPAWTLIRGPRWRVEKKKSTWLVLYKRKKTNYLSIGQLRESKHCPVSIAIKRLIFLEFVSCRFYADGSTV